MLLGVGIGCRGMAEGKIAWSSINRGSSPPLSVQPHRYSSVACSRTRLAFLLSMGLEAAPAPSPRAAMKRRKRSGRSPVEPASTTSGHVTKICLRISWSAVARSPLARTKRGTGRPSSCVVVAAV